MATVDFSKLKKMSSETFGALNKAIDKLNTSTFASDKEDYWQPTVDKDGNGSAIIRFVPAPEYFEGNTDEEDTLFVRIFEHGFKGPTGKWYIENSLTTLGQDDPVAKHNSELWNTGIEAKKEIVRKQKRKLTYTSNIVVVKDPGNPDNNGKVFKFKYGKKIFDKIKDALKADPTLDEVPINAFDVFEGANFKLSIRKVDGYRNYDKSSFAEPSALSEEVIQTVSDKGFSLKKLLEPSNFKSYEDLEKRLNVVLDIQTRAVAASSRPVDAAPSIPEDSSPWETSDGDDADLDYFKKLANDE